ncbi:Lichenan permease IIC component [compost metagenome]|uniref:Permease IIC component n=2 Tax=Clostridium intestinale TaxID=36845 RepID=A0A7D6ZXP2_9CLOT|nr:PTS sugar transporter subunit IIC [Clostridium intestinale]QLY79782.1 PTS sugar transporter subunit IIC [Clostridium intestinale]WRY50410.1 PTS sugar transporter subunit IIC [Clostridium intestinale]SHI21388.1 PTS system, cellobiose-specific IIC component [Clostridium intestinale DSM 6191]
MDKSSNFSEKIIEGVMKFVSLKGVVAVKDGIMYTLPLTLIGSVFLLLAQLPIPAFNNWMAAQFGKNWTAPLLQAYNSSFNILAVFAVFGIAYIYVKNEDYEPVAAGIIAEVVFFLTLDQFSSVTDPTTKAVTTVTGVIPRTWLGGKGMVAAIIIGLIVGWVYTWFLRKKITIKLPDGVPAGVSNQFAALIPGLVIIVGATVVYQFFKVALNTTLIEWIYKVLQTPLQGFSDSFVGALVLGFLVPFFWWFGVHGSQIVGSVFTALTTANMATNQSIIEAGQELTIANGATVVTEQFRSLFLQFGGSGLTLGLVFAMLIAGKSAQSKSLGKIALVPGLFNINEPVIFGFPIVMNPLMFVPFVAAPTVTAIICYLAIKTGMVPPFSGVTVPWTTPPIISGLLVLGWRGALLQAIIMVISTVIYFPFFKKQDAINLKQEQEAAEETAVSDSVEM